jgi:hypothetical protein
MKRQEEDKGVRNARREIEALEASTSSRAGVEHMPDRFYQWLMAELESEVERAQSKLQEAADWLATCEGAARAAQAARFAAAKGEGGLAGERTIKCQAAVYDTGRARATACEVLSLRQAKVRETRSRLARARAGVADAEQIIVETWSKNGSVHIMGPIEPMPTVQDVQEARDRAGVSILIHPTRQATNSWLGPTEVHHVYQNL